MKFETLLLQAGYEDGGGGLEREREEENYVLFFRLRRYSPRHKKSHNSNLSFFSLIEDGGIFTSGRLIALFL